MQVLVEKGLHPSMRICVRRGVVGLHVAEIVLGAHARYVNETSLGGLKLDPAVALAAWLVRRGAVGPKDSRGAGVSAADIRGQGQPRLGPVADRRLRPSGRYGSAA
jgi:hypothetical protein